MSATKMWANELVLKQQRPAQGQCGMLEAFKINLILIFS